jgi:cellulose synthase/poly-beta-1,6-N-acetylglucosamine synthase-like glycosyltransferase
VVTGARTARRAGGGPALALVERAVIGVVLGYTAMGARNIVRSARWKRRERERFAAGTAASAADCRFFLLVPALREQNIIESTLDHLRGLRYPADRFEIIVAVDGKEDGERTTADVVNEYVRRNPDGSPVTVVSYDGPEQRRSMQLNAALEYLRRRIGHRLDERVIVGVYDADSRPEPETLAYIAGQLAESPEALAFQQTVTYLANRDELVNHPLVHANAVKQSLWNYIFEIPRLLAAQQRLAAKKPLWFPPYCMGHGEFFDIRALDALGGFPSTGPCDGMQIGFALSRAGIGITPVPFDDSCQSPATLSVIFRQHTFWYSGSLQFFRWYRLDPPTLETVLPVLCHTTHNARWLLRPVAFAAAAASAYHRRGWRASATLAMMAFCYFGMGAAIMRRSSTPETAAASRCGWAWLPVASAFESLGAANAVIRMLLGKSTFNKVER